MGVDIAYSARLFFRFFANITGLIISPNSVLNYNFYLEQHRKTSTKIDFHPINISARCVLEQRSMLLHSSIWGDGSGVYPLSVVPPNEPINSEETVGIVLPISYFKQEPEYIIMTTVKSLYARTTSQLKYGK